MILAESLIYLQDKNRTTSNTLFNISNAMYHFTIILWNKFNKWFSNCDK